MRLLIIDNYDSFTFNLKHMCEPHVSSVDIIRNDIINLKSVDQYDKVLISPGPGLPQNAGMCLELIDKYMYHKPLLGICLGAQAIAVVCGVPLFNLENVMHGKKSEITILDLEDKLYKNLPQKIMVGRYHSWAINNEFNGALISTAKDVENTIMSFRHIKYPVFGIQYHPESILTDYGKEILKNWLLD
mgnify:FL=1